VKEICIYGRGGQGSLVLAQFMAIAALEDNKYGLAFPFLGGGGERRGKPIMAFCRLDDHPIRLRSRVSQADYIIVQDATILKEVNIERGIKQGGMILVNTEMDVVNLLGREDSYHTFTFPASDLARSILGRPIMNTALLGAFAALTKELSLDAVARAVLRKFPGEIGEKNVWIARQSYERLARG